LRARGRNDPRLIPPSAYLRAFLGADEEGRTPNLLFTKQLLCH
jgi:hypothetical protein